MPVLRVKNGPQQGRTHELLEDSMVLGREATGEIQVPDQGVSRRHAEIFRLGELYFIRDLESRNGTYLNDKPISEEVLRFGDRIRLGNTSLVFEDRMAALRASSRIELAPEAQEPPLRPTSAFSLKTHGDTTIGAPVDSASPESVESRNLNLLLTLDHIMSEETNLPRLLDRTAAEVGKKLEADNLYVFWRGGDAEQSFNVLGRFDRNPGSSMAGVSKGIIRDCLREGRAVLSADASLDEQFDGMASVVMNQLRSVMCSPITVMGKTHGVLYVHANRPEAFSAEDLELSTAVGIQLGTTIGLLKMVRNSDKFFRNSVRTLVSAIEMRTPENEGQSERVATYCLAIAKELGLGTHDLRTAWLAGMLHKIGFIPLSDEERESERALASKTNINARKLLAHVPDLSDVLPAIENQSERWDGSGTPTGRQGTDIPLLARILGLSLELDRLLCSTDEVGKELSLKETLLKLRESADRQFDRETVNALLIAYRNGKLFNPNEEFFEIPMD